jgi:hypothetical protein
MFMILAAILAAGTTAFLIDPLVRGGKRQAALVLAAGVPVLALALYMLS